MNRKYLVTIILCMLLLTACGEDDPEGFGNPTDTSDPSASAVEITMPQSGSVIYAEAIQISGEVNGAAQQFDVRLVTLDETVIAETTVDSQPGSWSVELIHDYTGEPTEIEIRTAQAEQTYDSVSILLSDSSQRPDGTFGEVIIPADNTVLGGDSIPVEGRASGLPENQLTVELLNADGTVLDTQRITLQNPYFIDDVPWQTLVERGTYTGPATLRITYTEATSGEPVIIDEVSMTLTEAAG